MAAITRPAKRPADPNRPAQNSPAKKEDSPDLQRRHADDQYRDRQSHRDDG